MVISPGGGGLEVWVVDPSLFTLPYDHEMCQALVDRGHRVRLVGRQLRPLEETASAPRYTVETWFYPRTEGSPRTGGPIRSVMKAFEHSSGMRRLANEVRRSKPDVVHFQWLALPMVDRTVLGTLAQDSTLVLTAHDATTVAGRGFSIVQRLGWEGALRHFSRLVVHSQTGCESLVKKGLDRESVVVVPHPPLPLPECPPAREDAEAVLMLFGEIKSYKGVDVAIEAVAQLPEALRTSVRLVVAGRPCMSLVGLKKLARDRGVADRVEWIDRYIRLDELPRLLGSVTMFLLPYREADASGVLSQILQLGRPILATRTGVFPELVEGGRCGVVVEPGDASSLAAAISRVAGNPQTAAEMGASARRLWQEIPSWTHMAERLERTYDLALSEHRRGN